MLTKLKNINNNKLRKYSNFHLTRFSFYPLLLSFSIWAVAVHWVLYFYKGEFNFPEVFNTTTFCGSIMLLLFSFSRWMYTIHKESAYLGEHTKNNQDMLKTGFIIFMVIESLLFFSLFFAFLYIAVYIPLYVSSEWPDLGINSEMGKLLSEYIFISFIISICILLVYRKFMSGDKVLSGNLYFKLSILRDMSIEYTLTYSIFLMYLSFDFIACQIYYLIKLSQFNGFIGSIFFMVSCLQLFHVTLNFIVLIILHGKIYKGYTAVYNNIGLNRSIWYWHFINIVWIVTVFICSFTL